jgi:hypothetical protein
MQNAKPDEVRGRGRLRRGNRGLLFECRVLGCFVGPSLVRGVFICREPWIAAGPGLVAPSGTLGDKCTSIQRRQIRTVSPRPILHSAVLSDCKTQVMKLFFLVSSANPKTLETPINPGRSKGL